MCLLSWWLPVHVCLQSHDSWQIESNTLAVLSGSLSQNSQPTVYREPVTGINFNTWNVLGSSGTGGLTFGMALPSTAMKSDATEVLGYLVCSPALLFSRKVGTDRYSNTTPETPQHQISSLIGTTSSSKRSKLASIIEHVKYGYSLHDSKTCQTLIDKLWKMESISR